MPNSGTHRVVATWAPVKGECVCTTCRRPMGGEVKHCVLDHDLGSLILCDSCYVQDDRHYGWEHRGNPFPARLGRVVGR